MIIRDADLDRDMPIIIKGARELAERAASWTRLPSSDAGVAEIIRRLATTQGVEILLAEHAGRVVGGIGMLYAPHLWNPSIIIAEELFWLVFQDAPRGAGTQILDEAMRRVHKRGAVPIFRALAEGSPSVKRAYRRRGLLPAETVFMMRMD